MNRNGNHHTGTTVATEDGKKSSPVGPHWLACYKDRFAALGVHQPCCELADIQDDGEGELILATVDKKLKIFKNSHMHTELDLMDTPAAMCCFVADRQSSLPCIAVASGPYVFIYKNLRPYFKFKIPQEELDERERALWDNARSLAATDLKARLQELHTETHFNLSTRSNQFLALESNEERATFRDRVALVPLSKATVVTCLSKLKQNSMDKSESDHLIVGTESGKLLVLQSGAQAIEQQYSFPDVPVGISAKGIWETDSRLVVGCRNGTLYTIRNKKKVTTEFDVMAPIVGFCLIEQNLFVACSDRSLHCYHAKGRKLWSMRFKKHISAIFPLSADTVGACLVGFSDGKVRTITWEGKEILQETGPEQANDCLSAVRFGRFGRENHCLIMCFRSGTLKVNIVPRRVIDEVHLRACWSFPNVPLSSEKDESLYIPKKTRLFIDYTEREQVEPKEIHRVFQQTLCRLRLETARAYVKLLSTGCGHTRARKSGRIELNVRLKGTGSHFLMFLDVTNQGKKSVSGIALTFHFDTTVYSISPTQLHLPVLVPETTSTFSADINAKQEGLSGQIFSTLSDNSGVTPLVSALIKLPVTMTI
eukprot:gb/GECG01003389.1/.p1 GENE.gb/GECG01003389.1/~~gb/GECG01003389.1/.p1  ORF type:complete len:595 (+),score=50.27 gb/GECG01003389.1/:1-1785(+)